MSVLAIIPARVGSKGIPMKNWTRLAGVSPVGRAIMCCEEVGCGYVVSSDREDLAGVLYAPAPLHTDTCSAVDIVLDALARVPGSSDQIILYVQPAGNPLRQPKHLHAAVALIESGCESVASVVQVGWEGKLYNEVNKGPYLMSYVHGTERRQDCQWPVYAADGTVYAFRRQWFAEWRSFMVTGRTRFLHIPYDETCPLDTPEHWRVAEKLLA